MLKNLLKNVRFSVLAQAAGGNITYSLETYDNIGRSVAITEGDDYIVTYEYQGLSSPMKTGYVEPQLSLDYTATGALDRFNRISDHAWKNGLDEDIVRIKHGYDRTGNRLYREDPVSKSYNKKHDELYNYDGVNQLIDMQRGELNATKAALINTTKTFVETFDFDASGNWNTYKRDDNGDDVWDLNQVRTHNAANEIVTISGSATNTDPNGNMTTMPSPKGTGNLTCTYDAWNRLVKTQDGTGSTTIAEYSYNGLNQRITKLVGNNVTFSYFNENWQELESRKGNELMTYVWGLRYIDDLIYREKDSERLYSLADPNWNVVAITDTTGTVKERMKYDAFGKISWFDEEFVAKMESEYSWNRTFTGQVLDNEIGLMLYRNRFYHTNIGRFISRDPISYYGLDVSLYRYVSNTPNQNLDSMGLQENFIDWYMGRGGFLRHPNHNPNSRPFVFDLDLWLLDDSVIDFHPNGELFIVRPNYEKSKKRGVVRQYLNVSAVELFELELKYTYTCVPSMETEVGELNWRRVLFGASYPTSASIGYSVFSTTAEYEVKRVNTSVKEKKCPEGEEGLILLHTYKYEVVEKASLNVAINNVVTYYKDNLAVEMSFEVNCCKKCPTE